MDFFTDISDSSDDDDELEDDDGFGSFFLSASVFVGVNFSTLVGFEAVLSFLMTDFDVFTEPFFNSSASLSLLEDDELDEEGVLLFCVCFLDETEILLEGANGFFS